MVGADLSGVRLHWLPEARPLGIEAFTVGRSIFFADRGFDPESPPGLRLIGHELAHVAQQARGRVANPLGPVPALVCDPRLELEAGRQADRLVAAGQRILPVGPERAPSAPAHRRGPAQPAAPSPRSAAGIRGQGGIARSLTIQPMFREYAFSRNAPELEKVITNEPYKLYKDKSSNEHYIAVTIFQGQNQWQGVYLLGVGDEHGNMTGDKGNYFDLIKSNGKIKKGAIKFGAQLNHEVVYKKQYGGARHPIRSRSIGGILVHKTSYQVTSQSEVLTLAVNEQDFSKVLLFYGGPKSVHGDTIFLFPPDGYRGVIKQNTLQDQNISEVSQKMKTAFPWVKNGGKVYLQQLSLQVRLGGNKIAGVEQENSETFQNINAYSFMNTIKVVEGTQQISWEWLHVRARSLGGPYSNNNYVAGTYQANSAMTVIEKTIKFFGDECAEYARKNNLIGQNLGNKITVFKFEAEAIRYHVPSVAPVLGGTLQQAFVPTTYLHAGLKIRISWKAQGWQGNENIKYKRYTVDGSVDFDCLRTTIFSNGEKIQLLDWLQNTTTKLPITLHKTRTIGSAPELPLGAAHRERFNVFEQQMPDPTDFSSSAIEDFKSLKKMAEQQQSTGGSSSNNNNNSNDIFDKMDLY